MAHRVTSDALGEAGSAPAALETLGRRLERAKRVYEMAVLVHQRAELWQIDSAPLAHHCLLLSMRVLLELHGEQAPDDFSELAGRTAELAELHGFELRELRADLSIIAETRARFDSLDYDLTRAEWRRYDRAFQRIGDLLGLVESELAALLPARPSRLARHWKTALLVTSALVLGLVIGTRFRKPTAAPVEAAASLRLQKSGGATDAFTATLYRDEGFHEIVATHPDTAIDFDWGAGGPEGLEQGEHFSARWTGRLFVRDSGVYVFFLTSDDGSRLFIDEQLVVDNWGMHATAAKEGSASLESGLHLLRVEYFEATGDAKLRLEWSSKAFARRLLGSGDLR